jgi:hypothetical protein
MTPAEERYEQLRKQQLTGYFPLIIFHCRCGEIFDVPWWNEEHPAPCPYCGQLYLYGGFRIQM